jgi:membrane protein implicated in regulation of membrane protease activity
MGFDIRLPIGFLFTTMGALLVLFGLATRHSAIYREHSLGLNINLAWGIILLIFGLLMVYFARRFQRREVRKEAAPQASTAKGGAH